MKHLKIADIIILLLILFLSVFTIYRFSRHKTGKVIVTSNGDKYEYSLNNPGTYVIPGYIGNTTFEIKNNKVRIVDSPCPNKTCIQMGWIDSVICLPNQVFITIVRDTEEGGYDAISN